MIQDTIWSLHFCPQLSQRRTCKQNYVHDIITCKHCLTAKRKPLDSFTATMQFYQILLTLIRHELHDHLTQTKRHPANSQKVS